MAVVRGDEDALIAALLFPFEDPQHVLRHEAISGSSAFGRVYELSKLAVLLEHIDQMKSQTRIRAPIKCFEPSSYFTVQRAPALAVLSALVIRNIDSEPLRLFQQIAETVLVALHVEAVEAQILTRCSSLVV